MTTADATVTRVRRREGEITVIGSLRREGRKLVVYMIDPDSIEGNREPLQRLAYPTLSRVIAAGWVLEEI